MVYLAAVILLAASPAYAVSFAIGGARFEKDVRSMKELRTDGVVMQSLDFSCGPACIATMLTYHFNDKVAERDIINYLLLITDLKKVKERKGFSLLDLKRYCTARGYEATGYRMDLADLMRLKEPVLVPINIRGYDHFVVLRGFREDRAFIADPVLGKLTMRTDKFAAIWKGGIVMVLSKKGVRIEGSNLGISREGILQEQDWNLVQHMLSESVLSGIYADGEFK